MPLVLESCTDHEEWDTFIRESLQANVFSETRFLDLLDFKYELYLVKEGREKRMGAILLKDANNLVCKAPVPFATYQGIFFHCNYYKGMDAHKSISDRLCVLSFFLEEIEKTERSLSFCLHPKFEDLRAITWFHYHQPELGQFRLNLSYTGYIDLRHPENFSSYLSSIRKSRRQDYQKAQNAEIRVRRATNSPTDLEILRKIYLLTFERQNVTVDEPTIELIMRVAKHSIEGEWGDLFFAESRDGKIVSASLFLTYLDTVYYWVGANEPSLRNLGGGTYLLLENIQYYKQHGFKYLDVCGMNSPTRGDFKASLNAVPAPYFSVHWDRPKN